MFINPFIPNSIHFVVARFLHKNARFHRDKGNISTLHSLIVENDTNNGRFSDKHG